MSTVGEEVVLGLESAGVLMTPAEFDAIEEYDENYRYELVNGVLVVTPIASAAETGPNELLGYLLLRYRDEHPKGSVLSDTLPQQYVVEFVSAGRRNWKRDYVQKRKEFMKVGIREYWIIDRFQRTLTVIRNRAGKPEEIVVPEGQDYQTPLLPGFVLPLARILEAADRRAQRP